MYRYKEYYTKHAPIEDLPDVPITNLENLNED